MANAHVLHADNFAAGTAHWQLSASGAGATPPSLVTTQGRVWFAPNAVLLGVGNTLGAMCQMVAQQYNKKQRAFGIEVGWSLRNASRQFEQWLYYKLPGQQRQTAQLKFDTFGKQVVLSTPSGDVGVANLDDANFSSGVFVPIKLAVDFEAGRYLRVTVGGTVTNVGQYVIPTDGGLGDYQLLSAMLSRQVNPASTNDAILGYVTVTADEL